MNIADECSVVFVQVHKMILHTFIVLTRYWQLCIIAGIHQLV